MPVTLHASDGTYLRFDSATSVDAVYPSSVSSHPTESRTLVSDHVQREPLLVSLVGMVTGSPLSTQLAGGGGVTAGLSGEARERAAVAWLLDHRGDRLSLERDRGEPLDDLVLTRVPDSTDILNRRLFSLELQQVLVAEATSVDIPPEQPVAAVAAAVTSEADLGEQTGTSGAEDTDQQARDVSAGVLALRALGLAE